MVGKDHKGAKAGIGNNDGGRNDSRHLDARTFRRTDGSYTDLEMKKTLVDQRKQKARDSVRKDAGKF